MSDLVPFAYEGHQVRITDLPRRIGLGAYLYVLELSNGVIKVGRAADPRSRIKAHESAARAHLQRITRGWLSPLHGDAPAAESRLITWCSERASEAYGREYFAGLTLPDVVTFAESLPVAPVLDPSNLRDDPASQALIAAIERIWEARGRDQLPPPAEPPPWADLLPHLQDYADRHSLSLLDAAESMSWMDLFIDLCEAQTRLRIAEMQIRIHDEGRHDLLHPVAAAKDVEGHLRRAEA